MKSIADIRKDYIQKMLSETDVLANPIEQFKVWFEEALLGDVEEVNAMCLATVDANHHPHARIVLLKSVDERGFSFFTNYQSHKGEQLATNNHVALVFFWKELERQVRIEGTVQKLSVEESDAYFLSRPKESRVGAWASPQSKVVDSREALENLYAEKLNHFSDKEVIRPPHWGGFLVTPANIEFWQGRESRMHDRIFYSNRNDQWKIERLAP